MTLTIEQARKQFETAREETSAAFKAHCALITEKREKVRPIQEERAKLADAISAIHAEYVTPLSDAKLAYNSLNRVSEDAFDTLNRVLFEDAQTRIETEIAPATLAARIDEILKSKRHWHRSHGSLGVQIVIELCKSQRFYGLSLQTLQCVDCLSTSGGYIQITTKQADRVWEYLESVCPAREDKGLAPPFQIEWKGWWNQDKNALGEVLEALLPAA